MAKKSKSPIMKDEDYKKVLLAYHRYHSAVSAVGRYKSATSRAFLRPGKGNIIISRKKRGCVDTLPSNKVSNQKLEEIRQLRFPKRVNKILRKNGISTVSKFLHYSKKELPKIYEVNRREVDAIFRKFEGTSTFGKRKAVTKKKSLKKYLQGNQEYVNEVKRPLKFFKTKYNTVVIVSGGGAKGQAKAIKLAISRAIIKYSQRDLYNFPARWKVKNIIKYKKLFKSLGYLTQDSRSKERKKYGLLKARKAPQFSKR